MTSPFSYLYLYIFVVLCWLSIQIANGYAHTNRHDHIYSFNYPSLTHPSLAYSSLSYPKICQERSHINEVCDKYDAVYNSRSNYQEKKHEPIEPNVVNEPDNYGMNELVDEPDIYEISHSGLKYYSIVLLLFTVLSMWLIYISNENLFSKYDEKILPFYN